MVRTFLNYQEKKSHAFLYMIIKQMDVSGSFKTVHELIFFVHQDKLRITAVLEMA